MLRNTLGKTSKTKIYDHFMNIHISYSQAEHILSRIFGFIKRKIMNWRLKFHLPQNLLWILKDNTFTKPSVIKIYEFQCYVHEIIQFQLSKKKEVHRAVFHLRKSVYKVIAVRY